MAPTTLSDNHPVVLSLRTAGLLTSAAGFISFAWSITHRKGISDDGAGSINSIVLGTVRPTTPFSSQQSNKIRSHTPSSGPS
jgi:hypothetical protein